MPQEGEQLPKRTYYHPGSFQAIQIGEWLLDIDSDDEIDESWRNELADSVSCPQTGDILAEFKS